MDQSEIPVLWHSWDRGVNGERLRKWCFNRGNDGGRQVSRATVTFAALVTFLWWSSVTEPDQVCPTYRQSSHHSVCMNTDIFDFLHITGTGKKDLKKKKKNLCRHIEGASKILTCMTFSSVKRRSHSQTLQLETSHHIPKASEHQFHALTHLASCPSSIAPCVSPATWLNSAVKGHGGPALPLSSPLPP